MLILKAAALAIVVCVLVLCLKKDQPGFAFLLSLCGAAGLLWFAVQQLRPLLARLQQLAGQAGGDSFSILLQVLAIAFVAQLAADLCREAGLAAAAALRHPGGRAPVAEQAAAEAAAEPGSFATKETVKRLLVFAAVFVAIYLVIAYVL